MCGMGETRGVISETRGVMSETRGVMGKERGVMSETRGITGKTRGVMNETQARSQGGGAGAMTPLYAFELTLDKMRFSRKKGSKKNGSFHLILLSIKHSENDNNVWTSIIMWS